MYRVDEYLPSFWDADRREATVKEINDVFGIDWVNNRNGTKIVVNRSKHFDDWSETWVMTEDNRHVARITKI